MVLASLLRNAVSLCIICIVAARAQSIEPIGNMTLESYDLGRHRVPSWSDQSLVVIDNNRTISPIVHVFDQEGRESQTLAVSVPGASTVGLRSVTYGHDGRLVYVGFAIDQESGEGKARVADFLGIVSADRTKELVIRTNPYVPRAVVIAPDKTIWTVGQEKNPDIKRDPGVIRHYDAEGKEIGSFVPQSTVRGEGNTLEDNLAFGNGHLGWYPAFGNTYFEVFANGVVRQVPGIALTSSYGFISKLAITDNGLTFVSQWRIVSGPSPDKPASTATKLYVLDKAKQTWSPVILQTPQNSPTPPTEVLLGSNGNTLALLGRHPNTVCFYQVK
jgi:hypothetical protein